MLLLFILISVEPAELFETKTCDKVGVATTAGVVQVGIDPLDVKI